MGTQRSKQLVTNGTCGDQGRRAMKNYLGTRCSASPALLLTGTRHERQIGKILSKISSNRYSLDQTGLVHSCCLPASLIEGIR